MSSTSRDSATTNSAIPSALDPSARWRGWPVSGSIGAKPSHIGLPTFAGLPYTENPAHLVGVDAAIVGAPFDQQVDHPGTRYGPRAIRSTGHVGAAHPEVGIDPLKTMHLVDYGDAPIVPGDGKRSAEAIRRVVGEVVEAGAVPLTIGGDHWITNPCIRAVAAERGTVGLVQFDAHSDTDENYLGFTENSHAVVFRSLVEEGLVAGNRYAQVGLRGYYFFQEAAEWQRDHGISTFFMHEVRDQGVRSVIDRTVRAVGSGPVYLTVDIDVLDPAFAPGTGTLDPGGMTTLDLLWGVRELCRRLDIVGADVVEVRPQNIEGADITAFAGHYLIREFLNGLALRRNDAGSDDA